MQEFFKILYFCCLICWVKSDNACFKNVEVVELPRFFLQNTTNVRVSWDMLCDDDGADGEEDIVRVTMKHLSYLSCEKGKRDFQDQELDVSGNLVIIEELHPYSYYSIGIKKRLGSGDYSEETIVNTSTKTGVPQIRVGVSPVSYDHKDSETRLNFNWRPPPEASQCDKFNSKLGSYHFKMIGLDTWNRNYIRSGIIPFNQTRLELEHLQPFSHYALFVYITNTKGNYSRDFFVKMNKRTKPSKPLPLENLKLTKTTNSLYHLSWYEPFPPTGEISKYTIRWRTNGSSVYLGSENVKPSNVLCEERFGENKTSQENEVCFTVKGLGNGEAYFFSVQSFNKGVMKGSKWSIEANSNLEVKNLELSSSGTLAVILVLAVVAMLVIVGLIRTAYKMRNKLEFKQNIKHYLKDSVQPPESVTSDTTMMTYISQLSQTDINPEYATVGRGNRRKLSATLSQRSQLDPLPPIPPTSTKKPCIDDMQGYLRPNFDRPERMGGSGSEEDEPPLDLPVESYISHTVLHL